MCNFFTRAKSLLGELLCRLDYVFFSLSQSGHIDTVLPMFFYNFLLYLCMYSKSNKFSNPYRKIVISRCPPEPTTQVFSTVAQRAQHMQIDRTQTN